MSFIKLSPAAEIPAGQTRYFALETGPILLANYEGVIYAVSGLCPHHWNPLEGAAMSGPLVECPYHQYQYDCRTGENHHPANIYPEALQELRRQSASLKRYSVEIRDGDVWVDVR
jgi:nitrite reductase/ring-hydroxylating ferredoxin subunit